ncbi:hypothetical protein O181_008855 [Austropuccinia psidii MF-1]|uniref:EF-hand domain-containing protein n=1 Tax=Austropuccinia psidii MF-1 TaxID=1389203 RepID=A0A9Q3BQR4_9BASI|nr:hypothetical protein [Austropuccinia psidii MF-1]
MSENQTSTGHPVPLSPSINDDSAQPLIADGLTRDARSGGILHHSRVESDSVQLMTNISQKEVTSSPKHSNRGLSGDSKNGKPFDWQESDESELDGNERLERQQQKADKIFDSQRQEKPIHHAKRLRKVYLRFMRLSRWFRTTLLFLLGSGLAILPALVVLLRFPNSPARAHVLAWSTWVAINIAAACATSIFVDVLPLGVLKFFQWFYGETPERLKTQVALWMNVKLWIKVVLNLTWYWVILLVIFSDYFSFRSDDRLQYFRQIEKVAAAAFTLGAALLAEKTLLQIIKLNFHRTSLKDRIRENERALWALDCLAAAKTVSHTHKKRSSRVLDNLIQTARQPRVIGKSTSHTKSGDQAPIRDSNPAQVDTTSKEIPSVPAVDARPSEGKAKTKKRQSSNLHHMTEQLTTVITNATFKDGRRRVPGELASAYSARRLARKLFEGLDEDCGGTLTRNEFEPYFQTTEDAAVAFQIFDKDGNGNVDRKEMRNAVSRIYRERKELADSLRVGLFEIQPKSSTVLMFASGVLLAVACLVTLFIWLFIFNPQQTSSRLVPMATIILGFSFVFGNAAKNLFESMLFIFSTHPYDVGDQVIIDNSHMFVVEFGLFSTTFRRVDGQIIVAPNSVLSSKKHILNIRRSGSMWEATNIMVAFDTPLEVLHSLRERLRHYVSEHPREWKGGLDVHIDFMKNQNMIQLMVAMEHKDNWQDWAGRLDRRTELMKEMKRILDKLNVIYKLPVQPVSFAPPIRPHPCFSAPSKQPGNTSGTLHQRRFI